MSEPRRRSLRYVASLCLTCTVTIGLAGCATTPSRSYDDYRHKAANTAEAMISAVATAQLAGDLLTNNRAFGPFINVTVTDAESDANSIASTFDSVQPPDTRSDDLKNSLDAALQQATSALSDLRIAVRRHHLDDARAAIQALAKSRHALEPIKALT
jgi:hypothetical protein